MQQHVSIVLGQCFSLLSSGLCICSCSLSAGIRADTSVHAGLLTQPIQYLPREAKWNCRHPPRALRERVTGLWVLSRTQNSEAGSFAITWAQLGRVDGRDGFKSGEEKAVAEMI